jgi:hypothetical protein
MEVRNFIPFALTQLYALYPLRSTNPDINDLAKEEVVGKKRVNKTSIPKNYQICKFITVLESNDKLPLMQNTHLSPTSSVC